LKITPLFEAAFERLCANGCNRDDLFEVLDIFEHGVTRAPRASGEPHVAHPNVWVYEIPYVARLPFLAMIYTIDDEKGVVALWNATVLGRPG
jgi:hypothetical protein